MPFSKLGLTDQLVQSVLASGYDVPTAIQERAIPHAIAGRDIIGCAQTGTGKTAAFALPILHRFIEHPTAAGPVKARALVLVPTRELAQQVVEFFTSYSRFTTLQTIAVYGGVGMEGQIKRLRRGVDVVVATPGRLLDHINRKTVDLSRVEILVLDEADRMLDMGFIHDVRRVIERVPQERQTLLFSATISDEVKKLTQSIQKNPELIEVGERRRPVDSVTQQFYRVPRERKLPFLFHLLKDEGLKSVLVFSRTKHGADKIVHRLSRQGVQSVALHSDRTQSQREKALAGFREGRFTVLVATDIAARGIDVEGISHVINYDTPAFAEDYIHRIGRTGRADSTGTAISFVSEDEMKNVREIEKYTRKSIALSPLPEFAEMPAPAGAPAPSQPERSHAHREKHPHRERHEGRPSGHRRSPKEGKHRRPEHPHGGSHERQEHSHAGPKPHHGGQHERRGQSHGGTQHRSEQSHGGHRSSERPHGGPHRRPEHSQGGSHPRNQRNEQKRRSGFSTPTRNSTNRFDSTPKTTSKKGGEKDWRSLIDANEDRTPGWRKRLRKILGR